MIQDESSNPWDTLRLIDFGLAKFDFDMGEPCLLKFLAIQSQGGRQNCQDWFFCLCVRIACHGWQLAAVVTAHHFAWPVQDQVFNCSWRCHSCST